MLSGIYQFSFKELSVEEVVVIVVTLKPILLPWKIPRRTLIQGLVTLQLLIAEFADDLIRSSQCQKDGTDKVGHKIKRYEKSCVSKPI